MSTEEVPEVNRVAVKPNTTEVDCGIKNPETLTLTSLHHTYIITGLELNDCSTTCCILYNVV